MKTRKSSCVKARGIPTVAYQVLHLLSCTGGTPCWGGVTPLLGESTPTWGTPHPDLARGYPIPAGVPLLGYPHLDLARVPPPPVWTWLGYIPSGPRWGTRHLDLDRVPPIWTWLGYPYLPHLDLARVSPCLDLDRASPIWPGWSTPSPRLDLAGVPLCRLDPETSRLVLRTRSLINHESATCSSCFQNNKKI